MAIIFIKVIFEILTLVVIANALLSFVLPPFNPVRTFLDKIVEPLLNPIRRFVPAIGGFDFSPIILLLALQLLEYLLLQLF